MLPEGRFGCGVARGTGPVHWAGSAWTWLCRVCLVGSLIHSLGLTAASLSGLCSGLSALSLFCSSAMFAEPALASLRMVRSDVRARGGASFVIVSW